MYQDIDSGSDLTHNCFQRKFNPHQYHCRQSAHHIIRTVRMTGTDRPIMACIKSCNISSASSPLTSPTIILSGRIRSAVLIRSRILISCSFYICIPCFKPHQIGNPCDLQFRAVLNGNNTFFFRNKIRQYIQKSCLS